MVIAYTDIDLRALVRARQITEIITDPETKDRAEKYIKLEIEREEKGETSSWKKMEQVRKTSPENIKFLTALLGFTGSQEEYYKIQSEYATKGKGWSSARSADKEGRVAFPAEVARIKDQMGVTVNITWGRFMNVVESGRCVSIWENPELLSRRNKNGMYHYGDRRDQIERDMNNRSKGGARDPHPIYGAVWAPNGRDEFEGGAGGKYGECFIKLKTDRVKDRTTFTYDDSFNGFSDYPLTWEDVVQAKAMLNLTQHGSAHGYVEAQILGGVTLDDIDTIYVPKATIDQENASGWKSGPQVYEEIEEARRKYPGIKIEYIEKPAQ